MHLYSSLFHHLTSHSLCHSAFNSFFEFLSFHRYVALPVCLRACAWTCAMTLLVKGIMRSCSLSAVHSFPIVWYLSIAVVCTATVCSLNYSRSPYLTICSLQWRDEAGNQSPPLHATADYISLGDCAVVVNHVVSWSPCLMFISGKVQGSWYNLIAIEPWTRGWIHGVGGMTSKTIDPSNLGERQLVIIGSTPNILGWWDRKWPAC